MNIHERVIDFLAITNELHTLCPETHINQTPEYLSLAIEGSPNKNAVVIWKGERHVTFFIDDPSLISSLQDLGLTIIPKETNLERDKYRHWVKGLNSRTISANHDLFRKIVTNSCRIVDNRNKKNR